MQCESEFQFMAVVVSILLCLVIVVVVFFLLLLIFIFIIFNFISIFNRPFTIHNQYNVFFCYIFLWPTCCVIFRHEQFSFTFSWLYVLYERICIYECMCVCMMVEMRVRRLSKQKKLNIKLYM